jgi:hypothetical protein
MAKKSAAAEIVRKSVREVPPASRADLDRLRATMQADIDTGEIPERRDGKGASVDSQAEQRFSGRGGRGASSWTNSAGRPCREPTGSPVLRRAGGGGQAGARGREPT